jgi:drug/metabolite transporter (DMT)-like permease
MTVPLLVTALSSALCVAGQTLAKLGLERLPRREHLGLAELAAYFASPWIWAGGLLLVAGTALWFHALARLELSVALPVSSLLTLVLSVVAGRLFFGESLPPLRAAGLVLALAAAALIARR